MLGRKKETWVTFATTPWRRMVGLMGKRHFRGVLVMAPCHDVHTMGMLMPIDVAFFGKDGVVMRAERGVGPGRRITCPGAYAVMEREAAPLGPWPWEGDRLGVSIGAGGDVVVQNGIPMYVE